MKTTEETSKTRSPRCLKILISAALALLLFSTACAPAPTPDNSETSAQTAETATEAETQAPLPDYGGAEFRILQHGPDGSDDVGFFEYDVEGFNGEIINDAVYERNARIEQDYHVTITAVSDETPSATLKKKILAGEQYYHVIADWPMSLAQVATDGILRNMLSVSSLDLSRSWWNQNAIDNFTIADKLYLVSGDYVLYEKQRVFCVLFNEEIALSVNSENDYYQTVRDGKWTMDYMAEQVTAASSDLNGDGKIRVADDRYGFVSCSYTFLQALIYGMDNSLAHKLEDGTYEIDFMSEHFVDSVDKLAPILDKSVCVIHEDVYSQYGNAQMYFERGNSLMFHTVLQSIRLWESSFEYGILPQPKYDESQENYLTSIHYAQSGAIAIPADNEELDMTGVLLDALSEASSQTVLPKFVEEVLKVKKAPSPESSEMVNLIFEHIEYDMFNLYSVGDIDYNLYQFALYNNRGKNYASTMKKYEKKTMTAYEKLVAAYQKLTT